LKEWTTPDSRNTPSTTNLEQEEIVDASGNDGNASMPEQVKRPNPWRKIMMMIMFVLYDKERPEDGDDWLKNGALLIRLIKIDINKVLLTVNK